MKYAQIFSKVPFARQVHAQNKFSFERVGVICQQRTTEKKNNEINAIQMNLIISMLKRYDKIIILHHYDDYKIKLTC